MEIRGIVLEYLSGLALDAMKEQYKEFIEEDKLRADLQKYIVEQEKYNEICSIAEECDFQGLKEYISGNMMEDVKSGLFLSSTEKRKIAQQIIVNKAICYSNAVDDDAKARVERLIFVSLEIVRNFYREKLPYPERLFGADIIDAAKENTDKTVENAKKEIIDVIKKQHMNCGVRSSLEDMRAEDNIYAETTRDANNDKFMNEFFSENITQKVSKENIQKQDRIQKKRPCRKSVGAVVIGIVGLIIVIWGDYFVFMEQDGKKIEPVVPAEELERVEKLELSGIDVMPLSMFESSLGEEKIPQNLYVEKKYTKTGYDKGCVGKIWVKNGKKDSVELSTVTLVVDEIKTLEEARPIVLGYMYNNKLEIYLINDGKSDFGGKVQLSFRYYDEESGKEDYLEDYVVERVLSPRVFGKYEELCGGGIARIAQYDISCTELQNWMKEHYENSGIYITAKVIDGYCGKEYEYDLGCMYALSSSQVRLERNPGEEYEYPVENPIVLDPTQEMGRYDRNVDNELRSGDIQNIQIAMLATESCEVTFHMEISTKDGEKIVTDKLEETINVPFYKNGKQNQYSKVLKYLVRHDIAKYYYNQDSDIQEDIAYKWEDMVKQESVLFSEDLESEEENVLEKSYEVTLAQNYDNHGLFGEVLRQYYEVAASRFSWETIQTKIYVNEGASNYYNSESYGVYFQYIDLADDGSPELVIAVDQEYDPMNIVDIFTIENDKVTRVIGNDGSVAYRNRYSISKDKTIKNTKSGGASNSEIEYLKLMPNSSELIPVDTYVYDGWDGEYYSHTNSMGRESVLPLENMEEQNGKKDVVCEGKWVLLYER